MAVVRTPGAKDAISVRHLSPTKEEREKNIKEFRAQKDYQQKLKEQRFATMKKSKKEGRKGINIKVETNK